MIDNVIDHCSIKTPIHILQIKKYINTYSKKLMLILVQILQMKQDKTRIRIRINLYLYE